MKPKHLLLAATAALLTIGPAARAEVRLPHLLSDGCVLQRGDTLRLWGTADAGERVDVRFRGKKYHTTADADGAWLLRLPPQKAGGPFELQVGDKTLKDVYVGDVWLTSGQSNMDLQVSRVADLYAAETDTVTCPAIHLIQIATRTVPDAPRTDLAGTERWETLQPSEVGHWSAVSYFFARQMYAATGVPQGIINSSQGGSAIEGWLSRDAIRTASPKASAELEFCLTEGYMERCREINAQIGRTFTKLKNDQDPGFREGWMMPDVDDSAWERVGTQQEEVGRVEGRPWRGTLWFRQTFDLTAEQAAREGLLRLGCLVDADETYLNGKQVGATGYQYPPRKYRIPAGTLHAGRNTLCIRLTTGGSATKFVQPKPYRLELGVDTVQLPPSEYRYRRGVMMPAQPGVGSFDNLATGYYNGMIAPLLPYRICGIVWYQGETNTGHPEEYQRLLEALATDWRSAWGEVPLLIVQLANFMQRHAAPTESNWAALRDAQRRSAHSIPRAALATAIDLGEANDIHPLAKKPLAERLALQARRLYLGQKKLVAEGPAVERAALSEGSIVLTFSAESDACATISNPRVGFTVAGADRKFHVATAEVTGEHEVRLTCPEVAEPRYVRYAWDDDPALSLFGRSGLPAASFEVSL
jgi:sialate O-acetylesterase